MQSGAASAGLLAWAEAEPSAKKESPMLIVDTHQHLWNATDKKPAWIDEGPELMRQTYMQPQYAEATRGLRVKAVYMEVDMAPELQDREAEGIIADCKSRRFPTVGAVIGGRPAMPGFEAYVKRHLAGGWVKGVRQVLHAPNVPAGFCLGADFVAGMRVLGRLGLSFDLCLRPKELRDGAVLAAQCPETRFMVDHCGNADVKAFDAKLAPQAEPDHTVDEWVGGMAALAKCPNVFCKISGIIARLPQGKPASALAPIVDRCLELFGPDRVVFGGDWPVCLNGGNLRQWVDGLREIVAHRPEEDQKKLWQANAQKWYGLPTES